MGLKRYGCYIKSHTEAPDFEAECEMSNFEDAVDYFLNLVNKPMYDSATDEWYGGDWGREEVAKHVFELPEETGKPERPSGYEPAFS